MGTPYRATQAEWGIKIHYNKNPYQAYCIRIEIESNWMLEFYLSQIA